MALAGTEHARGESCKLIDVFPSAKPLAYLVDRRFALASCRLVTHVTSERPPSEWVLPAWKDQQRGEIEKEGHWPADNRLCVETVITKALYPGCYLLLLKSLNEEISNR